MVERGYVSFFGCVFFQKPLPVGGDVAFDADGIFQIERPEGRVHDVAAEVAKRAGAEIPPRAPACRVIGRVIGPHRGGADPQIPVQPFRDGGRVLGPADLDALRPDGRFVQPWTSRTLPIAPSRIHSRISRLPSPEWPWLPICVTTLYFRAASVSSARFLDRMRERLLHIDVLAALHRRQRNHRVGVIGRRDDHRINVLLLVEHHAEIFVDLGARDIP